MYTREKLCRDENYKSRKHEKNPPSFSSTLLDEIYRSIDGNVEKSEDINGSKEKNLRRQGGYGEAAAARRVEKWMEKEANEKAVAKKRQQLLQELDNDLIFFSSTSSSSDSSGALSSSDTEFFGSTARSKTKPPKVSCFTTRPKPVRTGNRSEPKDDRFKTDDRSNPAGEDDLIKSKSRTLKIYANLKKVKQPISPGGRLTTFINSLFSNANGKKSRNVEASKGFQEPGPCPPTACSSASSFSRSCLSKYSPGSRGKMRTGEQRTVRFEPVSVIVDEELRPCRQKSISDSGRFGRPPLPPGVMSELKLNKKVEMATYDNSRLSKGYNSKKNDVFYNVDEDEEDDEDCLSDSSSDLFELDHLAVFGSNRYSEELPVYETTHFGRNSAIASGLIR